ncbi:hypothetical protein EYF80_033104 [Liparis tanakae]|uniref:Uncharacterized protein n=1 Tax=Liparis tanakae TaxID=230148 RepID=A0A4Z2GSV4_9TELE|nr:hypothetical protein EYF80_033104 [Liparis tanakae]
MLIHLITIQIKGVNKRHQRVAQLSELHSKSHAATDPQRHADSSGSSGLREPRRLSGPDPAVETRHVPAPLR